MYIDREKYLSLQKKFSEKGVKLVAVSKTKPAEAIMELYSLGHRDFGENYVQELVDKQAQLPKDIRWHFIGHLQTNKVKYIIPFVHLIHGVDSEKLLREINKQAQKANRIADVLLQVHISSETTKFGLDQNELREILEGEEVKMLTNIRINGLMGMGSFTDHTETVQTEFNSLKQLFDQYTQSKSSNIDLQVLSMGMSGDYEIAVGSGSTLVRIGSLIFGERNYAK